MAVSRPHVKPLTSLRFFAALVVVIFHFGLRAPAHVPSVFTTGFVGVNFFFLLSGFILVYNYLDRNGQMRIDRPTFWVARFARIYPVYLVAFVVGAFPYFWAHHSLASTFTTAVAGITLTQAWIPSPAGTAWNGPGWSLSAEAFFYLVFPLCVVPLARLNRRQLYLTMALMWLGMLMVALLIAHLEPSGGDFEARWSWERVLNYNPLVRLPEFLLGIALGRLFVDWTASGARHHLSRFTAPGFLALAALIVAIGAMSIGSDLPSALVSNGLFDPIFMVLIYNLAFNDGKLASILSTSTLILLGEASYALYILHYTLFDWLEHDLHPGRFASSPIFFATYMITCLAVAVVSLQLLETPARRAIRRVYAHRSTSQLPVATVATEPVSRG